LLAEHDARSVNAVMVAAEAAPSHTCTQEGSVGMQFKTQRATGAQLVSFGQLVGLRQQLAAIHEMQAAVVVPKI
jgi:UDP-N-acetylenolpyruvoylglucosamine reductase